MSDNLEELKIAAAEAESHGKWQGLHTEATIKRELTKAAEEGGAYNTDQLYSYLRPNARLVEVDGKESVRIAKTDDTGQEVMFTPEEAVAHLRRSGTWRTCSSPPLPPSPPRPRPAKIDWKNMTHDQYLKLRAKLGFGPKR